MTKKHDTFGTVTHTGDLYEQVERMCCLNEANIGEKHLSLSNMLAACSGRDPSEPLVTEVPYELWTIDMHVLHAELRVLNNQNELLDTILSQNKPSLLAGVPDQQE